MLKKYRKQIYFGRGQSDVQGNVRRKLGKMCAFTLAEVLITIGIIGVVAAITMPILISNLRKNVTVTRMKKFYTTMSQAVNHILADNDPSVFNELANYGTANQSKGEETLNWYNTYLSKYISSTEIIKYNDGILVKLADGSAFTFYGYHTLFCVHAEKCVKLTEEHGSSTRLTYTSNSGVFDGKETFAFIFKAPFKAYDDSWDGKRENLFINSNPTKSYGSEYGCSTTGRYCAMLIIYDGWQISKDYPHKF